MEHLVKDNILKFDKFKSLLLTYNSMYNLTAIIAPKEIEVKHFEDSLAGINFLSHGSSVVEIGSGAGFPSFPLKIVRDDLKFTLIESTGKKCKFLRAAADALGLTGITVVNMRAEDAARDTAFREKFDFAVARAVARLNTLCEYCLPFVKTGGIFIAYKGDAYDEIDGAKRAISALGGELQEVYSYTLGELGEKRCLVVIKKVKNTDEKYPRGQGKERSKPL